MTMAASLTRNRPNDYFYDSSNISSGPKDFYKQAKSSKQAMMSYAICPIFPSMFSDLQNYPCKQYVIRRAAPIPAYVEKVPKSAEKMSRAFVAGSDRYKYFHNSPISITQVTKETVPQLDLNCFYDIDRIRKYEDQKRLMRKTQGKNVKVQTIYRETSAQTSPWQPDYTVVQGNPELLKLDFLKWGEGLPPGTAEIEFIDRMRNKHKWESTFPEGNTARDFKQKRDMIVELNRIEWANRERDIELIQALRLELLEKMLNEIHEKSKCRNEQKMRMFVDMKIAEKQEKIAKVQKYAEREKRRLRLQFAGVLTRYGKVDIFDEHANYNSELYCPLMRNGTNPRYKHEELCKFTKLYKPQYCNVENYNSIPNHLSSMAELGEIKLGGTRLCIKETKWTLPVLKNLYEELKELRVERQQHPNLRVCIQIPLSAIPTPEISDATDKNPALNTAATFLQKILRGRAAQNRIFIGRERCHELIDELRGNYALLKGDVCKKARIREKRREDQLNANRCMSNMKALEGSLRKLSGSVTGTLLDFLNKDLQRLRRERRAHALILLVDRLRQIREAEEAGRRQKEIRRRKEHDEMFKQVVKVHQDTVDLYLQDIITEGMQFASEEKANEYVQTMLLKADQEQAEMEQNTKESEREDYIASMVHNFVIPEVEKTIIRDRMKQQQKLDLLNAHEEIYKFLDTLPKPEEQELSIESFETASTSQQKVIEEEQIKKTQETERQTVIEDIRAILDDLVAVPYRESTLKQLIPCSTPDEPDDTSSTTETVYEEEGREEGEGDEMDIEEEEKYEALESEVIKSEDEVDELVNEEESYGEEDEQEEELKLLRVSRRQIAHVLRVCIQIPLSAIPTPEISDATDKNPALNTAATFLQKILRGRAAQNRIFIGRERCHELIDELRGNYALLKGDVCKKARIREKRREDQLNANRCMSNMKALEGSLRKLSGSVTGTLLDFLNKDLQRLRRERRAHALILLVDRLRQIREAEEAGRRQKEIRRRKEHDEMFKQVVKVHQDTVDLYLQDIITEGMQFASEEKANEYVQTMLMKADQEQAEMEQNTKDSEREDYIASMVHNFVIPEVEKTIIRDRMKQQQKLDLLNAHEEIYKFMDTLPKPEEQELSIESFETASTSQQKVIEEEQIKKTQETERQTVIEDIRAILDDLVAVPYRESTLKQLIPCSTPDEPDDTSSTTETVYEEEGREEGEGDEMDMEEEEKYEALESEVMKSEDEVDELVNEEESYGEEDEQEEEL
ncbi:cilia- and flagella-associated protein 91-like [Atheta coriaria]|uniref:cilia- and flagella-associated protein 91-like n=1 Tax=Dalotia coriaria TaxID=877792 RepID=UPI0031F4014A